MKAARFLFATLCLTLAIGGGGCSSSAPDTPNSGSTSSGKVETQKQDSEAKPEKVSVGKTFTIPDMFEVNLDSAEWRDEVVLGDDSVTITMGEQREGASYFVIKATVKNIGTSNESVGNGGSANLCSSFTINDKYNIEANMGVDNISNFYEIEPLMTADVYIYGAVSNELKDSFESCELTLTANKPDEDGVWHLDAEPVGTYVAQYK